MFKRKLTINDFPLIVINLIPLYGVWFEGWDASRIFLVYCLETVIIGLVNVLRMAGVTLFYRSKDKWHNNGSFTMQSGWFFIFFFIVHYGFFVFVQTQIFFGVSGIDNDIGFAVYRKLPQLLGPEGRLLLFIFIAAYCWQMVKGFYSGEYKEMSLMRMMFQPYARIFVQQVIVILGGIFLGFGAGKIFIVILVAVKLWADLYLDPDRLLRQAEINKK